MSTFFTGIHGYIFVWMLYRPVDKKIDFSEVWLPSSQVTPALSAGFITESAGMVSDVRPGPSFSSCSEQGWLLFSYLETVE